MTFKQRFRLFRIQYSLYSYFWSLGPLSKLTALVSLATLATASYLLYVTPLALWSWPLVVAFATGLLLYAGLAASCGRYAQTSQITCLTST